MWLLLTSILVTSLIFYFKRTYSYWKRHGVPSPDATWIVGNMGPVFTMSKHFGTVMDEFYNKYTDVPYFGYYKCITPVLCVRDINLIKDVLIKEFQSFASNDFGFNEKADPLLAHNPFVTSGERWKTSRQILTPLFTSSKIKTIYPLMVRACARLKEFIKQFGPNYDFDAKELSGKFTTDNVSNISFSMDSESFSNPNSEFRTMSRKLFEPTTWQAIQFMIIMFLPWLVKVLRIRFLTKEIDGWMRRLVRDNVESRKHIKLANDDLLEMLLATQNKTKLNQEQVAGYSLSFFTEGTETSSTLLCNIMYELACHQDIQQKLYEEVCDVLDRHNNEISYDAIQEMSYLESVIFETLRVRPIIMTMQKSCTRSYKLDPIAGQKEGFVIPVGMSVVIPVNAVHFDAAHYPNPHEFDPSRFNEEEIKQRPKCVYMPFGEGPRMCMGMRLALGQTKAALVHVVKSFKINLSPNCKPFVMDPAQILCVSKNPLLLNYETRT